VKQNQCLPTDVTEKTKGLNFICTDYASKGHCADNTRPQGHARGGEVIAKKGETAGVSNNTHVSFDVFAGWVLIV
jgi:hypothetical protein